VTLPPRPSLLTQAGLTAAAAPPTSMAAPPFQA
jgi:hypothetical protein